MRGACPARNLTSAMQGSYLCGACSSGFFLDSAGLCTACPVIVTGWDRFGTLILLMVSVAGFVLVVFSVLSAAILGAGGSLKGMGMVSGPSPFTF